MLISRASVIAPVLFPLFASAAIAASAGMAVSNGAFVLNGVQVRGTATLAEGAVIESRDGASLSLTGGGRMSLSPGAQVKVYSGRVVLDKGAIDVNSAAGLRVEAVSLLMSGAEGTRATIAMRGPRSVQVAPSAGRVQVRGSMGMLIANVDAGSALEFEPQQGTQLPSSFVGCLLRKGGRFVIFDQTTRMEVELRPAGVDLAGEVGNRVQANGSARPGTSGAQIVEVTTLTRVEQGGCADVAKQIGADAVAPPRKGSPAAPAPKPRSTSGVSAGTKVGIVLAVAGGGGAAAAVALTRKDDRSR
ncbi:MAG: hypothetical protein FJW39_17190 [Acidobacteria bacterium]|nr:hypothetical protein [Acidobacteriota bacterium]